MFESRPSRHPLQTFQFWFLMLLGFGSIAAWKLNLISLQPKKERLPVIADEPMPPPPAEAFAEEIAESFSISAMPPQREDAPLPQPMPANLEEETAPQQTIASAETTSLPRQHDPLVRTASAESTRPLAFPAHVTSESAEPRGSADPTPPVEDPIKLVEVDRLIDAGEDVAAHRMLSSWYWKHPDRREELMDRLNLLARRIYFQPQPHYMEPYVVQFGEHLQSIAKAHNVSWEYLSKLNRVEPEKIRAGQSLKVIQGPFSCVVDLSDFELTVHAHGYYVTRFSVGIGKDGSTPIGTFKVTDKLLDPTYYGPDGVIEHDDPRNPLGERWIAISNEAGTLQGYGIHGTIEPETIGRAESRGCIRLGDREIADLYDLLTVGSEVIIRR